MGGIGLLANISRIRASDFDGRSYKLPLRYGYKLSKRVSAKINLPIAYTDIEDSEVYNLGLLLSVPVKVVTIGETLPQPGNNRGVWGWELTPTVGAAVSGSEDYLTGSVIYIGALTSMLSYSLGRYKLTLGNHISFLEGQNIEVDDYSVGGEVSQRILKNGLKLTIPFAGRWVAEGYGIRTDFLNDAAVESYWTAGIQFGMRLFGGRTSNSGVLIAGIVGDFGDDYESITARLGTGFRF